MTDPQPLNDDELAEWRTAIMDFPAGCPRQARLLATLDVARAERDALRVEVAYLRRVFDVVEGDAALDSTSETDARLCPRSFASHPANHVEDIGVDGWGRCVVCGETVNVSGERIPEHRAALDSTAEADATCTGLMATWCPVHGNCTCPGMGDVADEQVPLARLAEDGENCPLHGLSTSHADSTSEADPPRRITGEPPGWEGTRALHERVLDALSRCGLPTGIDPASPRCGLPIAHAGACVPAGSLLEAGPMGLPILPRDPDAGA